VGFNPFRDHQNGVLDIVMVILAVLATLGVIAWAIFGF
jgi:hypothetical protein